MNQKSIVKFVIYVTIKYLQTRNISLSNWWWSIKVNVGPMINKDEDTEEVIDIEQEVDEPDLKDQNI